MALQQASPKKIYIRVDNARLPSAYQEVEYIESNWTQHIDTWLTVSGNVKADYEYMPKENVSSQASWGLLFSMDTAWKNNWFGSGNVYLYYWNNTSSWAWVSITTLAINTKFHDIVSKDWCSRNGWTVWTPSSTSTSPTWTLKLFVTQRNGSITNYWWTRMFTFKRYDNDVLTQDLVPCYRKADSVAWLYDLVNDQFFTNAGTWTFAVGPDV